MVRPNVCFHPQAEEEVQRAYGWYHERNPTVARTFLADLDHAVMRVIEAPECWPFYLLAYRKGRYKPVVTVATSRA
jgi:plasmid stabilization system protein ParE